MTNTTIKANCVNQHVIYRILSNQTFIVFTVLRRSLAPGQVTSGGIHLRGLAPGQHSSEKTSQRWRAVGDTVPNLTDPGIELQIFRTHSNLMGNGVYSYLTHTLQSFRPLLLPVLVGSLDEIKYRYYKKLIKNLSGWPTCQTLCLCISQGSSLLSEA